MKILSYSLFEPLVLPKHRFWDQHKDKISRYYYNIPALLLTNRILYPDYITRIYITSNVLHNNLAEVFNILKSDKVQIVLVNIKYRLTEPSILRMMPLWEGVEVFHTRDLDSVPTEIEYRYSRSFEKANCGIGTLRTHENHYYGYRSRMLAGLSSFKPDLVPDYIKGNSFIEYFKKNHGKYGCDQDLMIATFTTNHKYTANNFYDCKAYHQRNLQDFPCLYCSQTDLSNIVLSREQSELFNLLEDHDFNNWAGEPIDIRGEYTKFILSKFP